jgi:hypothetical protein
MRAAHQIRKFASTFGFHSRVISRPAGIMVLLLTPAIASLAATYTVTNTNDDGPGSLRAAVAAANATPEGDAITFSLRRCPGKVCTIVLTSGQLTVESARTAGKLTISNVTGRARLRISGNDSSRIFYSLAGSDLTVQGITFQHGRAQGGGAIKTEGTLFIFDSVIESSYSATVGGGGILNASGSLHLYTSEVRKNFTDGYGGGVSSYDGSISIRDSTLAENIGWWGGGITLQSYYTDSWRGDLVNVTISGNESRDQYGQLDVGGGIFLTNSMAPVYLVNVTVTNNRGNWGGGVAADGLGGGSMSFMNCIFAGNIAQNYPEFGTQGIYQNLGNSIIGEVSSLLGPLSQNGGFTRTHALTSGSPAVDGGNNCVLVANGCGYGNPALTTDQRGVSRVGSVDIGAYEYAPGAVIPRSDIERDR